MYVPPGGQPAVVRDMLFEAVDYLRAKDLDHRASDRQRVVPHVDDVAGSAAVGAILPRRLADHRLVPDQHDGVRRPAAEHARQQHPVLTRRRLPRDDSRSQPGRLHGRALWQLSRPYRGQHAVLRRGLAALLGTADVRSGLPRHARRTRRRPLLAHAPLRAHHLLAQLPHGDLVPAGGHRFSGRQGRSRARQRHGRGAPIVSGRATGRCIRPRTSWAACSCGDCGRSSSTRGR